MMFSLTESHPFNNWKSSINAHKYFPAFFISISSSCPLYVILSCTWLPLLARLLQKSSFSCHLCSLPSCLVGRFRSDVGLLHPHVVHPFSSLSLAVRLPTSLYSAVVVPEAAAISAIFSLLRTNSGP